MVNRAKSRLDQDLNPVVEEDKDAMDMFDSNGSGDEQDAKGEQLGDSMRKLIPNDPLMLSPPETGRVATPEGIKSRPMDEYLSADKTGEKRKTSIKFENDE